MGLDMPHGSKWRSLGRTGAKAAISALLLILIVRQARLDLEHVATRLATADLVFVAGAMLAFPALIVLKSLRWALLIRETGHRYPVRSCIRSYFAGFALGVITPGRLGEFAKATYLRAEIGADLGAAIRTVIADRIYDLLFLCSFGSVGYLNLVYVWPRFAWVAQFLAFHLCIVIAVFAFLRISRRLTVDSASLRRFKELMEQVAQDFRGVTSLWNWLLTVLAYGLYFAMCYLLLLAIGIRVPFLTTCFIMGCMSLAMLLPISIAGFGPREATLVFLLGNQGVSAEAAVSFALLQFLTTFLFGGILGAIALLFAPLPLRRVREQEIQP